MLAYRMDLVVGAGLAAEFLRFSIQPPAGFIRVAVRNGQGTAFTGFQIGIVMRVIGKQHMVTLREIGLRQARDSVVDRGSALKTERTGDKIVLIIDHCEQFGCFVHLSSLHIVFIIS